MPTFPLGGGGSDFSGLSIAGAILDPVPKYAGVRGGLPCGMTLYVSSRGGLNYDGSNTGSSGDGTSINAPLSTLQAAMTALANRQNKGDVIYVLPGHTESVSSADYFSTTGTASGFSVIGLGSAAQRPQFTWTTAGSTWLIDTAGVELANLGMYFAGPAGAVALTVAAPITVSAAGCRIANCYIQANIDVDQISTIGITTTAAADDFEFVGNFVEGGDNAGLSTTFLRLVGADRCKILNNTIVVATSSNTVGPVQFLTTASTNVVVNGNNIQNAKTGSTAALTGMAGLTGVVMNNLFRVMGATVVAAADNVFNTPGSCQQFNNLGVDADGLTGVLTGVAAT